MRLFAGLDVSTQSGKLVVLDLDAGEVVHVDAVNYDRDLPRFGTAGGTIPGLGEGVSESDPLMWLAAVELLFERLGRSDTLPADILALSVSGQQHGLVALTADGRLARPRSKLWNDYSTAEECRLLTDSVGGDEAMLGEVGNTQRPGYTAGKILHLKRHEPDAYAAAGTLFLVHNYVNWFLTGADAGGVRVMEPGDTSGMALWHPGTGQWSDAVLSAIGDEARGKLPPVAPSTSTIGAISPLLADRYGFSSTCRIDAGSGDNMYGAVGTGNVTSGIVTVSLGTSGTAYTCLEKPFIDPHGEIAAFCDSTGRHLPLVCVSNMANGYDTLLRQFDLTHDAFDTLIDQTPPGNGGRLLVPWYEGERTPDLPLAACVQFGFAPGDIDPATMCRAVLEGHVLNLHGGCERLPVTPGVIHLTGGLSQSRSWRQAIADIFDVETVPVRGEGAALGAAIHAAWVWLTESGEPSSLSDLVARFVMLDESSRCSPREKHRDTYRTVSRLYRAVTQRIRGLAGEDPFELRRLVQTGATTSP